MKLNINLNEVPDRVPVLEPGQYDMTVESIELVEGVGKKKTAYKFTLTVQDGPSKGWKVFDDFPPEFLQDANSSTSVRLKHLAASAGIAMDAELDTDDLIGKTVQAIVNNRNYTDTSGDQQTAAGIKSYVYQKKS